METIKIGENVNIEVHIVPKETGRKYQ